MVLTDVVLLVQGTNLTKLHDLSVMWKTVAYRDCCKDCYAIGCTYVDDIVCFICENVFHNVCLYLLPVSSQSWLNVD